MVDGFGKEGLKDYLDPYKFKGSGANTSFFFVWLAIFFITYESGLKQQRLNGFRNAKTALGYIGKIFLTTRKFNFM